MKNRSKSRRLEITKAQKARKIEYDKMSLAQKIAKLPIAGAKKQRARFMALVEKQKDQPSRAELNPKYQKEKAVVHIANK
jgi:hypothetical protein